MKNERYSHPDVFKYLLSRKENIWIRKVFFWVLLLLLLLFLQIVQHVIETVQISIKIGTVQKVIVIFTGY